MSFDENPADDRYQLDQCIDEIKSLQSQITTLAAERDEARKEVENVNIKLSGAWNLVINNDEFDRCISSLKILYGIAAEHAASHETKNAARDVLEVCGVAEKMRDGCVSRDAQIDSLTAELAALKSCPAMAEVRSILLRLHHDDSQEGFYEWGAKCKRAAKEAVEFATSAIASREEVVGLLKWCWMMFDSSIVDLAADHDYGEGEHEARRIREIVEGK